MLTQKPFKLSVKQVRQRIYKMVDHRLHWLSQIQKKQRKEILIFNQALLQEWYDLLVAMVYFKEEKKISKKADKIVGNLKHQNAIERISILPPKKNQAEDANILIDAQQNRIQIFQIQKTTDKGTFKYQAKQSAMQFERGTIHDFCSCTCIDQQNVILVGGSRQSDNNLKSHDVLKLNLLSREVVKVGNLPYGLSSHGAIRAGDRLFLVGGNKNFSIVTKKCLSLSLKSFQTQKIADLNYPSASHSLLLWKNQFIYKIGGIGSCFGEWDLSPYIERYDIQANIWEIVNPSIKINQNLLHHYSLLVNSLVYVSSRDTIVVLGGVDLEEKGSRKMFQIAVKEETLQGETYHHHQIIALGEVLSLTPGCFTSQQSTSISHHLFCLQTLQDPKEGTIPRVVSISKELTYF